MPASADTLRPAVLRVAGPRHPSTRPVVRVLDRDEARVGRLRRRDSTIRSVRDPCPDRVGGSTNGSDPAALPGRCPQTLEFEERQAELQHAEDQHDQHADDQSEFNGCGSIVLAKPLEILNRLAHDVCGDDLHAAARWRVDPGQLRAALDHADDRSARTPPGRCAPRSRITCSTPPAPSPAAPTPAPAARPCADS